MSSPKPVVLAAMLLCVVAPAVPAQSSEWQPSVELRYRFERVDDDRFLRDAEASTARLRAGLVSPEWSGWQFGVTGHANQVIGSERYNSTANGRETYPVVADPEDEGVSQAWIGYRHGEAFRARAGRQRLIEDNARFLGNVGFRQLEQTFDAVHIDWRPADAWRVDIKWLDRAHRVFGRSHPDPLLAEADLDAWFGTVSHAFGETTIAAYAHRIVYDDRPASHRNLGVRILGLLSWGEGLRYRAEFAHQKGLRELSGVDDPNYLHLRLEQQRERWHWFAGHERLEGDGAYAFQTPLATLHAHNGWTDRFLTTPADGLIDTYAGAGTRIGEWTGLVKLHRFESDRHGRRYGNEYGAMLRRPLPAGLAIEAKWARFDARGGNPDTDKLWLTLEGSW